MNARQVSTAHTRVRNAHRRLLDGFAAFRADDADDLRGLRAFLMQELGPHARLEEAVLRGAAREVAAFEHAFLRAELDALSRTLSRGMERSDTRAEVRRRIHRLEAAIELHVQRTEDDTAGCEFGPSASSG